MRTNFQKVNNGAEGALIGSSQKVNKLFELSNNA